MVIKFDHISYSAPMSEEATVRDMFGAHKLVFEERDLDNLDIKSGYFDEWHEKHNILMLGAEGQYPVELTLYDKCNGTNSVYSLNADWIEFKTPNISESKKFLGLFDFVDNGSELSGEDVSELSLKPMFDAKIVTIKLVQDEEYQGEVSQNVMLDRTGFGSLALVVDSIDRYADKIREAGYTITETKSLMVNGKMLKIAFASGSCSEIVELIGVR